MNLFRRIRFNVRAFFASRDGSTPERPRRDGSYGWPQTPRRHDPSDHDCHGGAPGDRFPF